MTPKFEFYKIIFLAWSMFLDSLYPHVCLLLRNMYVFPASPHGNVLGNELYLVTVVAS